MSAELYQVRPQMVSGLTPEEASDFNDLLLVWQQKLARNARKKRYYDAKNGLRDLGIAIPPPLRDVETVVGWPAKAVDALAVRSIFDGFTVGGDEADGLSRVLRDNDFRLSYSQAVTSELVNSCAFATVSQGTGDEPEVLISFYSALNAAAKWDYRRKRIRCGFAITGLDWSPTYGTVATQVNMYTDGWVISCERRANGRWVTTRTPNPVGRPLMEPLRYRPSLDRPFGKSRVSRAVMSITDSAVRTCLRAEVSSELYTAPQRYLLGADEDTFGTDEATMRAKKIESYLGTVFAITPNENGDIPQYGQLAQMSMQPHTDYMRNLAARLAGETGIPISSLGVIHDNPASAEAMYAASEDLIIEAEALNDTNGRSLENVAMMALALMRGVPMRALSDGERGVRANFKNPMRPSIASQTDALMKQLAQFPWMGESEEALRIVLPELGYSESKTEQLIEAKQRYEARQTVARIGGANGGGQQGDGGAVPRPAVADQGGGAGGAGAPDAAADAGRAADAR